MIPTLITYALCFALALLAAAVAFVVLYVVTDRVSRPPITPGGTDAP